MNPSLTVLENAVLDKVTAGDLWELRTLRQQWRRLSVVERHDTGVGFVLLVKVPDDCPLLGTLSTELLDVGADVPGLQAGMEFAVFIRGGHRLARR